jgi:hypothetical protein
LKAMGDPAPRSAREALTIGETRPFVVTALDTPRRGIDLALPGYEQVREEDVDAAKSTADDAQEGIISPTKSKPAAHDVAPDTAEATKAATGKAVATTEAGMQMTAEEVPTVPKKTTARKAAKKRTAKKTTARKSTARKTAAKKSTARKSTARKSTARKSTAKKKSTARKSPAKKKSTARKSTAKKKKTTARKAPAKRKTTARKSTARKRTTAKKA